MTNKTLRDEIAMAVLTGLVADGGAYGPNDANIERDCKTAFAYADAMLAARGEDKPKDDGWIKWSGGECPVSDNTKVEVKLRDGLTSIGEAWMFRWDHRLSIGDIIAYRVVEAV